MQSTTFNTTEYMKNVYEKQKTSEPEKAKNTKINYEQWLDLYHAEISDLETNCKASYTAEDAKKDRAKLPKDSNNDQDAQLKAKCDKLGKDYVDQ
jgi:ribosomal protein S1